MAAEQRRWEATLGQEAKWSQKSIIGSFLMSSKYWIINFLRTKIQKLRIKPVSSWLHLKELIGVILGGLIVSLYIPIERPRRVCWEAALQFNGLFTILDPPRWSAANISPLKLNRILPGYLGALPTVTQCAPYVSLPGHKCCVWNRKYFIFLPKV